MRGSRRRTRSTEIFRVGWSHDVALESVFYTSDQCRGLHL
jgi:hypothetical protein